jgi:transcriptional regulator CBF1
LTPIFLSPLTDTVERRRREVINEGIENIAKVVPGQEKNKGAILQRTLSYILELQANEKRVGDERQVMELAIEELTKRNELLRNSNRQAWNEVSKWQQRCRDLGGEYDDYNTHAAPFGEAGDLDDLPPS